MSTTLAEESTARDEGAGGRQKARPCARGKGDVAAGDLGGDEDRDALDLVAGEMQRLPVHRVVRIIYVDVEEVIGDVPAIRRIDAARVDAQDGERLGLFGRVVDEGQLEQAAATLRAVGQRRLPGREGRG